MKRPLILLICILIGPVASPQKPTFSKTHPMTINPNPGYVTINDVTYGYGLGGAPGSYSERYTGFTTMHGYQLNIYSRNVNRSLIAGAGTGVLFYNGESLIPLYLDFRYILNFKRISPYLYEDSGVLLNHKAFISGTKMFINPGAGIKINITGSLAASLAAGLFVQMGADVPRDSFVNLKLGIAFKPGNL
jgi:hypothetical protein